ncbi:hypothetical protein [Paraburkholderia tropica]|uniref:hypothetical protein n=1 Tax=Paraburkholderia tropica TaxID=92647 RepID=UPI003D2BB623
MDQAATTTTEVERRAYDGMRDAFERLRYLSMHSLNEEGRRHMFLVADAAHNLPASLMGDAYHRPSLERDVVALEALLGQSMDIAGFISKNAVPSAPRWLAPGQLTVKDKQISTVLRVGVIATLSALLVWTLLRARH